MNGHDWLSYLKGRRPKYASNRIGLIEHFANKGRSKSDYVQFGPIYQFFMYAVMIGFHRRERIPLPIAAKERIEFVSIDGWYPPGIVNYLIMLLIAEKSIQEEIGLDLMEMENMEDTAIREKFKQLVTIMEEYANGGMGIISERFERDPYFFSDAFAFPSLLKEIADGQLTKSK